MALIVGLPSFLSPVASPVTLAARARASSISEAAQHMLAKRSFYNPIPIAPLDEHVPFVPEGYVEHPDVSVGDSVVWRGVQVSPFGAAGSAKRRGGGV